jgi:hypothetical protein
MSFAAYRKDGRDVRSKNLNSRDTDSGVKNEHRFQRMPIDKFGHSEPPSDLALFKTSSDNLMLSYAARQRELTNKYIEKKIREEILSEQEKSRKGLKSVTLDEDDDSDFVPMVVFFIF